MGSLFSSKTEEELVREEIVQLKKKCLIRTGPPNPNSPRPKKKVKPLTLIDLIQERDYLRERLVELELNTPDPTVIRKRFLGLKIPW